MSTVKKRLCTFKELKEVFGIPYCRAHVDRLEKAGQFPLRVRLGQSRIVWVVIEIEEWIADRIRLHRQVAPPST